MNEEVNKFFAKIGKTPPEHHPHGSSEDIKANLRPLKPSKWWMEGNLLIGETEMGRLVQPIPPNYICTGVDKEGNPILEKIDV